MAKPEIQRSAGGVVYQERDGDMWVALIATKEGRMWGLPKGLIEKGEGPLQAALREVREEAGLLGEPVAGLGCIEYWFRDSGAKALCHKFVHYYLLSYTGGDVGDHGWEVDEARWFRVDQAMQRCSYENEREVLAKAREEWDKLLARTT